MTTTAVLFDLDGTLLDTAQDFILTINLMRHELHLAELSFDDFKKSAYGESNRMVSFGFEMAIDHPEFETIKQRFLDVYQQNNTKNTVFFPGISSLLDYLDHHDIAWGIVTNKPSFLMTTIIKHFNFDTRAKCIVSGDTLSTQKPHPEPLLHACRLANLDPKNVFYVGDMETDIIAAKAAGMKSIAVTYGYHSPHKKPHSWNADYVVDNALDIINLLE